jgi:cystathionine gamma-lyase
MVDKYSKYHQETRFIHSGQDPDPTTGAVVTPISLSTTFAQRSPGVLYSKYDYSRSGNPTREAFERCLALSEGGKFGLAFASGLAATNTIFAMYSSGDHILTSDDVYGGTRRLMNRVTRPRQGVDFSFVNTSDLEEVRRNFKENTKMIWIETPTNPTLKISDIAEISKIAHEKGALVFVDNTFASPYCQSPLALGADVVVHSVTKYIGGHTDVVMGVIAMNDPQLFEQLKFLQNAMGGVPGPFDCYNALKGMKTLHLRMQAHSNNALQVAQFLESHPKVEKVIYPGLLSHPHHEIAKKQMKLFSGMITFYIKGGLEAARTFLSSTEIFICAESLGAVECLMEHPGIMTHASVPAEVRAELGISDSLIRLSIGVEHIEDIIQDLSQALDKVNL